MVDVLCGESIPAGRVHAEIAVRAGGSAVNAAIAASTAGAEASVVGRIGADPSGALVLAALERAGVRAKLGRDPDLTTGVAIALGSNVVAHRGANAALSPDDVPDPLDADALLVSGFALFQPGSADAGWAALERFQGKWAAVDVASPGLAEHADIERLASSAAVLLVTNDEARVLTGTEGEAAATQLARRFRVACVKLGEAGAVAAAGDELVRAAAPRVEESSPFGAGDAFAAALLVALASDLPLAAALERACEAGAHAAGGKTATEGPP
jgi:sugar/nucleoside kinase (ribokinase family)